MLKLSGSYKILKMVVIVAIVLSLVLYIGQSDWNQIMLLITQMGWGYLLIIFSTFIALLCGTASWAATLPRSPELSFWRLFYIRLIGENIGLINPSNIIGGDAMKAYLLGRKGLNYTQSTASLLISRLIMIGVQVILFFIAIGLFFLMVSIPESLVNILFWLLLGFTLLLALCVMLYGMVLPRLSKSYDWVNRLQIVKKEMNSYYQTRRLHFYKAVAWSILNFLIGSLEFVIIFYFLGHAVTYIDALLVDQGVLVLKSFGAFVPGQIGIEEYANKVMFGFIGINSSSLWIAASILRRSRQLFWIAISVILYYIEPMISKVTNQYSANSEPLKS